METAYNRIVQSGLSESEKGLLQGLLTKPEVVQVINLGNETTDIALRGILRINAPSMSAELVVPPSPVHCIRCLLPGTIGTVPSQACNHASGHNFVLNNAPRELVVPPSPVYNFQVPAMNPALIHDVEQWIQTEYSAPTNLIPLGPSYNHNDPAVSTLCASDNMLHHNMNMWLHAACGAGEQSQIQRNDSLLKSAMILAGIPPDHYSRDTHQVSTVETTHPDFQALFNGIPLFLAEEKEGDDYEGARNKIISKFVWVPHYFQLDFFITFAICFSQLEINIMQRGTSVTIRKLFPLGSVQQRLSVLKVVINISSVLKFIVSNSLIAVSRISFGRVWVRRPLGKDLRLGLHGAEFRITERDGLNSKQADAICKTLKRFYIACGEGRATRGGALPAVPFIESLDRTMPENPIERHFFLKPIGIMVRPKTLFQLCDAIICIVSAIWGIHQRGWMHGDIRWDNVVKVAQDRLTGATTWFVIDCYRACERNTPRALSLGTEAVNNNPNFNTARHWTFADDRNLVCGLLQLTPLNISNLFANVRQSIVNNSQLQTIINQVNLIRVSNQDASVVLN